LDHLFHAIQFHFARTNLVIHLKVHTIN